MQTEMLICILKWDVTLLYTYYVGIFKIMVCSCQRWRKWRIIPWRLLLGGIILTLFSGIFFFFNFLRLLSMLLENSGSSKTNLIFYSKSMGSYIVACMQFDCSLYCFIICLILLILCSFFLQQKFLKHL